jgi:hypothetical protein
MRLRKYEVADKPRGRTGDRISWGAPHLLVDAAAQRVNPPQHSGRLSLRLRWELSVNEK